MSHGVPVPINARFGDDFITQLVLVVSTDTIAEVAAKVAAQAVGKRVRAREAQMVVRHLGRQLPADLSVEKAGIRAGHSVSVDWADK